jgi:HSP20 family protein
MAKQQGTETGLGKQTVVEPQRESGDLRRADPGGQPELGRRRGGEWPGFFTEPFGASPFTIMRRMFEDADRMFGAFGGTRDAGPFGAGVWMPHMEVIDREAELVVRADLPGMKREDVRIEVTDGTLVVSGERRVQEERTEGGYRRSERRYGSFERALALPEGCDPDQATAEFKNGVLEIKVPHERRTPARQIEIRDGGEAAETDDQKRSQTH